MRATPRCAAYRSPAKGGVAQLGEHLLCKQGVIGSIPFTSTTIFGAESISKGDLRYRFLPTRLLDL
jgi:hypothetical protein